MDAFVALTSWMHDMLLGISGNFWLSFWFIFIVALAEDVFILGLFIPSTPIMLLAGGLIGHGKLPFWEIFVAAAAGAAIGDSLSYLVGYLLKDRIKSMWPFRDHLPLIARGEEFFRRHGGASIFIGRFIPGVKAVVPGIAGMLGMPYRYFSLINIVSSFVWSAAHLLPGFLLSAWLASIGLSLEMAILVAVLVVVAALVLIHFWRRIAITLTLLLGSFGRDLRARLERRLPKAGLADEAPH